jgi:predicted transcriptional regulator
MITREITIKESKGAFSLFKKALNNRKDFNFEGMSALRQVLSNEKARMLYVIKTEKPTSLYALAKKLGRNFKSVYEDSRLLERFGFIELIAEKTNNRVRYKPKITTDTITINIKI